MPIKGLSDRGEAFPNIGQIRKGAKREKENTIGKELPYFRVEFDEREIVARDKFLKAYGPEPTLIRIVLPFNEITRQWDPWLEAYTAGRMVARSDGEWIRYLVDVESGDIVVRNGLGTFDGDPVPHPPDGVVGVTKSNKPIVLGPVGRLRVVVPELERAAYLTVITHSKNDISNISSQLQAFSTLNNGHISGVPFTLIRKPQMISTPGKTKGSAVRRKKFLIHIEADPDWVGAKIAQLHDMAMPTPLLPGPGDLEEVEGEVEWDPEEIHSDNFDGDVVEEGEIKGNVFQYNDTVIMNAIAKAAKMRVVDIAPIVYDARKAQQIPQELTLAEAMEFAKRINA